MLFPAACGAGRVPATVASGDGAPDGGVGKVGAAGVAGVAMHDEGCGGGEFRVLLVDDGVFLHDGEFAVDGVVDPAAPVCGINVDFDVCGSGVAEGCVGGDVWEL